MNATPPHPLHPKISTLINTVLNLEKGRTFQIRGQRIYPSEVHLLLEVAGEPEANLTDLAARLDLTKGAVSQTLARLERKGLVVKTRDPAQKNALNVEFTSQGTATVAHFQQKTAHMREQVAQYLAALSPADHAVIGAFLDRLTGSLAEMGGAE